jgi:hypothetical protein
MREDGKCKTRDSQMWKRVQVQARRRYGDLESTRSASKYLDDIDIWAGYQDVRSRFIFIVCLIKYFFTLLYTGIN